MMDSTREPKTRYIASLFSLCFFVAVFALVPWGGVDGVRESSAQADKSRKVMGVDNCVDCHKSEIEAWKSSKHHGSYKILFSENGKAYAQKLGVTDVRSDALCVQCHGASPESNDNGNSGVFCESCHGPSENWLNRHGSYGAKDTKRADEKPAHKQKRRAFCEAEGMIRPENLYGLVKNCLGCHYGQDEKLAKTGHKVDSSGFELVKFSQGEVRHNLQQDQKKNATAPSLWLAENSNLKPGDRRNLMYVVGKVADLEKSLRKLATATGKGAFFDGFNQRLESTKKDLKEVEAILEEKEIDCVEIGKILEVANKYEFRRFNTAFKKKQKELTDAAETIARLLKNFAKEYDPRKLSALAEEEVVPDVSDSDSISGKPYSP